MTSRRFTPKIILQLAILALGLVVIFNYETLLDKYALATYRPPSALSPIINQLGLTDTARAILYRSDPKLDAKAEFNTDCTTTKGELELGCYANRRIYVLQIENPSLRPEMNVVTAHELLHAAWVRLSASERATLTTELETAFHGLGNADLNDRMASYAKSEPGEEANELHSILGTEYANLSPQLEAYYARYFTNRSLITSAQASYEQVFSSRRDELAGQLATIRQLKGQLATVNAQLDRYNAGGQIAAYNALVPRQNSLVDEINGRITIYQQGVDEYNALSVSLDSQSITDTESNVGP